MWRMAFEEKQEAASHETFREAWKRCPGQHPVIWWDLQQIWLLLFFWQRSWLANKMCFCKWRGAGGIYSHPTGLQKLFSIINSPRTLTTSMKMVCSNAETTRPDCRLLPHAVSRPYINHYRIETNQALKLCHASLPTGQPCLDCILLIKRNMNHLF